MSNVTEEKGKLVSFAGSVVFILADKVLTRLKNENVAYAHLEPDVLHLSRHRFSGGAAIGEVTCRIGQAYGHSVRVIDHAIVLSKGFFLKNLFYLYSEL